MASEGRYLRGIPGRKLTARTGMKAGEMVNTNDQAARGFNTTSNYWNSVIHTLVLTCYYNAYVTFVRLLHCHSTHS
jgi:hypothetical protein